ncbi:MAG TPA: hypothetical protein DEB39_14960 [Planctomycetaceae bacterium]|nr:hypothetical protein [Planctomycetaceae bacterium]
MGKSRKTITFRDAVKKCPAIGGGLCDGLQALSQQYRGKVRQSKNVRVTGSIDIDSTLKRQCPTDNRWDYGFGLASNAAKAPNDDRVSWVEIHPATAGDVKEVIRKLQWLKNWLQKNAPELNSLASKYVWIPSKGNSIPPSSPQHRELASKGIVLASAPYALVYTEAG